MAMRYNRIRPGQIVEVGSKGNVDIMYNPPGSASYAAYQGGLLGSYPEMFGGLGAANALNTVSGYSQQMSNKAYSKPPTEEELKKQEEEQMAREEEQKTIRKQKKDKATKFFIAAITCLGLTVTVIAVNCNLNVHDYNTAIVSSVLWGLGIAGLGFTALLMALGFANILE